jgi:signal transduction histidine kinase/CheY-like chemotaxis protein
MNIRREAAMPGAAGAAKDTPAAAGGVVQPFPYSTGPRGLLRSRLPNLYRALIKTTLGWYKKLMNDARFKLMVLALGACIAVLGTATISRAVFTGRVLIRQSLGRVEYSGSLAASRVSGWLESQIGYLNGVAEDMGWMLESYDRGELRSVIEAHYQNYETTFFQMYFGYPDGTLWFPGEWTPPEGWRADERDWYRGALENPLRVFVSDPYRDLRTGRICITISKAVLRNGALLAVVGVDVYLSSIQRLVDETPIAEGQGFAFLVDGDSGVILAHPDPRMTPGEEGVYRTVHDSFGGVYRELLNTADGESIFIAGFDGTRRYCNSQTISSAGWKLFSLVDQDTIRIPIERQTSLEILLSVAVLLLMVGVLLVTSRAMRRAALTAKEHSDMKTAFLANMSHEIRTPMNGIIGFAELALENSGLAEQTRDYLVKIRNSARDLLGILNDILDVSKIEAGKVVLEKIPFDLHDLITACESTISVRAAEKGIGLYIYSEPVIEYLLLGDPTKLRQALLNLLSNAVKFTNVGTVKLMVAAEKTTSGKVLLRFEIKDSGIGMTTAQMANIFQPFEQADRSTTRKFGGTGLGLSISKNLVELMGGKLSVESAPGIGTKFSFALEFESSDVKTETRGKEFGPPGEFRHPAFSGRILVCEDNTMNQELIRDHLGRLGLAVDIKENGRLGLEAVQSSMEQGRPYDLIFMDIHMPVMDGLEASSAIRRLGCSSPIIALTANVLTQETGVYYRYGIADHLGKPFTTQELWDCLSRYLPSPGHPAGDRNGGPSSDPRPAVDYQAGLATSGGNRELYEKLRREFYRHNRDFWGTFLVLLGEGPAGTGPGTAGAAGVMDDAKGDAAGSEPAGARGDDPIVTAHRMVHNLKSSAALIGAEGLREAAAAVEAALKEGGRNYSREQLAALRGALEAALVELGGSAELR